MSTSDEHRDDAAFERWLLDSAREDALPPHATQKAWARFAAAAGAVGVAAGSLDAARLGTSKATVAKWLLIGALGGGAAVALWLRAPRTGPVVAAPAASTQVVPAQNAREASETPGAPPAAPPPSATAESVASAAGAGRPASGPPLRMRSTLAAEVALLDEARRALAEAAPDAALRTLASYQRRFPSGLLATDAEVLTIEALGAKGEGKRARERAVRFLSRYPGDAHTERVRALSVEE